jgi:DNA end-binding protein Ku
MPATVWKGLLTFGLVSIPIRLHRAARKERIPLHYVSRRTTLPADRDEPSDSVQSYGQPSKDNVHSIRGEHRDREDEAIISADEGFDPQPEISRVRQSLVSENDDPVETETIHRGSLPNNSACRQAAPSSATK